MDTWTIKFFDVLCTIHTNFIPAQLTLFIKDDSIACYILEKSLESIHWLLPGLICLSFWNNCLIIGISYWCDINTYYTKFSTIFTMMPLTFLELCPLKKTIYMYSKILNTKYFIFSWVISEAITYYDFRYGWKQFTSDCHTVV